MRRAPAGTPSLARFASLATAGFALAVAALVAAPQSALLPAPHGFARVAWAIVLGAVFVLGLRFPVPAFFATLALTVLEGAVRRWVYNDLAVFLVKDFGILGVYAAVLRNPPRGVWRRPWWLVAPLASYLLLTLLLVARSASLSQAAVGLRAYLLYVPLFFVAPLVLRSARLVGLLAAGVLATAIVQGGLAVVQLMSSETAFVNKLVSGAKLAAITVGDAQYVRPVGTFMQSGSLSAFLAVAAIVAFATVAVIVRNGVPLALAVAASVMTGVLVVVTGARTLLGGVVIALGVFALVALRRSWSRRLVPSAGVIAGIALALVVVPQLDAALHERGVSVPRVTAAQIATFKRVVIVTPAGRRTVFVALSTLHVTSGSIRAYDGSGNPLEVKLDAGGPTLDSGLPVQAISIVPVTSPAAGKGGVATNLLGRSAGLSGGDQGGLWAARVKPPLVLITHQRLLGHGTGTASLGQEYVVGKPVPGAESEYAKVAYELGLPGLFTFAWFLVAVAIVSLLGLRRARGGPDELGAVSALGVAVVVPFWLLVTYALDVPIVGELFFTLTGLAAATAAGVRVLPERS